MKKLFVLLLLTGVLSCHKDEQVTIELEPVLGPVIEATGKLSNSAPVDGCGLLLIIPVDSTKQNEYAVSDK